MSPGDKMLVAFSDAIVRYASPDDVDIDMGTANQINEAIINPSTP